MATLLDVGLLQQFGDIFPIVLVLVLMYSFLVKVKYFEENHGGAFMIAAIMALIIGLSPVANRAIQLMAPYYVILFMGVFFVILSMMVLGAKEDAVSDYIFGDEKKGTWASWTVGVIAVVIAVAGFGKAAAEKNLIPGLGGQLPPGLSPQEAFFYETMFHPKVMGMLLVLAVVIFTVNRLAAEPAH